MPDSSDSPVPFSQMSPEDLILKMANLAKLELTAEEVRLFSLQLDEVLGYMALLQEADVSPGGVPIEPMSHPIELATALREDVVQPSPVDADGKPKVLASAPETLYDGFKVPPIL